MICFCSILAIKVTKKSYRLKWKMKGVPDRLIITFYNEFLLQHGYFEMCLFHMSDNEGDRGGVDGAKAQF